MTYRLGKTDYREMNRQTWRGPALWVVLVLAFYLWGSFLSTGVDRYLSFLSYPFLKINIYAREHLSGMADYFISRGVLEQKITTLENEQIRLRCIVADKEVLQTENNDLKTQLLLPIRKNNSMLAEIISRPDQTPYDILLLDGGLNTGRFAINQLVIIENIALGRVMELGERYTKVKLFSSYGNELPVIIGKKSLPAVAVGVGGGNFTMTLPRDLAVLEGDSISAPLLGDFVLGNVGKIIKDENNPSQKIIFKLPVNIYELRFVQVLK